MLRAASLSADGVCSVLVQANLYKAAALEGACLKFVKENAGRVVATPAFGKMAAEWSAVAVKVNIALAGLTQSVAKGALQAAAEGSSSEATTGGSSSGAGSKRKRGQ